MMRTTAQVIASLCLGVAIHGCSDAIGPPTDADLVGHYALADSIAFDGSTSSWHAATGGTLDLRSDHTFSITLPSGGFASSNSGDWSRDPDVVELQAVPGWTALVAGLTALRDEPGRSMLKSRGTIILVRPTDLSFTQASYVFHKESK